MKMKAGGTKPPFIEQSSTTLSELGASPLFTISIDKLEVIFKTWVWEVLKEVKPEERTGKYLTMAEACERLHISKPTLTKYIKLGLVKGCTVGSRVLISEDDLISSLADRIKTTN